jgi:hypothetical protein
MTSILDRYGIKEVADVTFIDIENEIPVLFLDTLKVSTIEETADQTEARGGKGNAPLIIWDYGKEINITLQDALYSPKSMAIMHSSTDDLTPGTGTTITKYINVVGDGTALTQINIPHGFINGTAPTATPSKIYDENGESIAINTSLTKGTRYIAEYEVTAKKSAVIEINASTFPGTYKVVGDTYARSDTTGQDEYFQFVISKAKMSAETTITLEAEGDPSVFDMNLRVLRPDNGVMMQLIQYSL